MLVLTALLAAAAPFPEITLEGNVALPDPVYMAFLRRSGLPGLDAGLGTSTSSTSTSSSTASRALTSIETFEVDAAYAERVARYVEALLLEAGYVLAKVQGRVEDGAVHLRIDEGKLEGIVFIGAEGGNAINFRLALQLPGEVFNRHRVETDLQSFVEQGWVSSADYVLVPVEEKEARGPQIGPELLSPLPASLGPLHLIAPGRSHELRVYVEPPADKPGFNLGFGLRPPDGVYVTADWAFANVFTRRDRFELDTSLGVDVVELADRPEDRLGLSRAYVRGRWFTPPLGPTWLRAFLQASASAYGRVRDDIGVRSYIFTQLGSTVNLQLDFGRLTTYLGAGFERRDIWRVVENVDPELPFPELDDEELRPPGNTRPLLAFGTRFNLSPDRLRKDRIHSVDLDVRLLSSGDAASGEPLIEIRGGWRNCWTFGYDEFRAGVRAAYVGGDVPYYSEVAFGDGFLRAAFLDEIYTQRIASLRTEYRLSLSREVLKVSLFNDLAVFEALDATRVSLGPRLADDVGLGLHLLALSSFQFDLWGGIGFTSDGMVDVGISLGLTQVF